MENTEVINTGLSEKDKNAKTHAIIAYALMLLGFFTGISFLAGGIWGIVKKSDAQGTVFADHYDNITKTFFVSIVLTIIGALTAVFVIGYVVLLVAAIYTLWKLIAGLAKITSDKSFN
ncbi:DUF4870 family protein [Vibrio sp. 10N.222.51.C8]|jgi:uncharacterized membrane protein|uniref:DUF4870 domain-containing protein n=2 Tax=Vibrio TaxID=662 RepID=A0A1C3JK55_9VIBR|nr:MULTISPECIES: membrane protein [Vibrio]NOH94376.1 hypothetical protein [Vibrio sp. AIC-3]OEE88440.1 hypothetical protein A140_19725 [Vibrio crassostreae 9ZC88]PMK25315.1 hypothetical protein BCU05_07075 [Vibrio sp. 10N.261.54.C3]PML69484.1 hypothetical protein BCT71_16010 [Vibrio sp. 10N.261.51.A7]PMN95430.1 hypothetical protein BCT21_03720 [Vibrio sp. 10N.222.55.F9]